MPSIIGEKNHHRVVIQFKLLQLCQDSPDAVIHALDHGGILGIFMAPMGGLGLVFFCQFVLGLDGGVDRVVSQVEKKWLLLVRINEFAGLLTEPVGQVFPGFGIDQVRVLVGAVVTTSRWAAPFATGNVDVEALGRRVLAKMPLAHGGTGVPIGAKGLCDGHELFPQFRLVFRGFNLSQVVVATPGITHCVDAVSWGVLSGHQAGPAWGAIGCIGVGAVENCAFRCQLVDVGCLIVLGPHEADIRPSQVIDKEENDVGLPCGMDTTGQQDDERANNLDEFH